MSDKERLQSIKERYQAGGFKEGAPGKRIGLGERMRGIISTRSRAVRQAEQLLQREQPKTIRELVPINKQPLNSPGEQLWRDRLRGANSLDVERHRVPGSR